MPSLKICRPGPGPRGPLRKYGPGCGYRESCRELFKELKILPLHSTYSLYYCSLLIIGIVLFKIVYIITVIPDKKCFTLASGNSGHVSEGSLLFRHQNL